jgi:hypothetical protein
MSSPTPFHVLALYMKRLQKEGQNDMLTLKIDELLVKVRSIPFIELFLTNNYRPGIGFMFYSAFHGFQELMKFAKAHHFPYHEKALKVAIEKGHIVCIEYLLQEYTHSYDNKDLFDFCLVFTKRYNERRGMDCCSIKLQTASFKYFIDKGFGRSISEETLNEVLYADLTNRSSPYEYHITNELYKKQLMNDDQILQLFEDVHPIDFRRMFELNPTFKQVCVVNDLTRYSYVKEKVTKVKETIEAEQKETKILQSKISNDVIQHIVWNYL